MLSPREAHYIRRTRIHPVPTVPVRYVSPTLEPFPSGTLHCKANGSNNVPPFPYWRFHRFHEFQDGESHHTRISLLYGWADSDVVSIQHTKNTHSGHGHGGVDVDMCVHGSLHSSLKSTEFSSFPPHVFDRFHPPRAVSGRASTILPSGTPIVRPVSHLPLVPPRDHLSPDFSLGSPEGTSTCLGHLTRAERIQPGPTSDPRSGVLYQLKDTLIESRTLDRTTGFLLAPTNELDVKLELAFFIGVPTEHIERVRGESRGT